MLIRNAYVEKLFFLVMDCVLENLFAIDFDTIIFEVFDALCMQSFSMQFSVSIFEIESPQAWRTFLWDFSAKIGRRENWVRMVKESPQLA